MESATFPKTLLKNIPFPKIENEKQQLILRGYNTAVEMKDEMISSLHEVVRAKSLARNLISNIYRDKLGMEEPSAPVLKVRVVDSSKIQDRLDWKTGVRKRLNRSMAHQR
ncbi:MAG: hypothetical protein VBE63_25070 [Lamprobacter sp.]|uniref:hypothetical protein n=1 Tax=Lamprobacter sp. TaxID=3100796 RepID=UPI002B261F14|nr:hypothetical protein [Lamprobacter sp.]MEA3643184.1 hypothetical protein [Lamprobacter sp.]